MAKAKYNVLKAMYSPAGKNSDGEMQFYVKWKTIGEAVDMASATAKFGHMIVLEAK